MEGAVARTLGAKSAELGYFIAGRFLLFRSAFGQDLLQQFACTFPIAHFFVGMGQFQLGRNLGRSHRASGIEIEIDR